MKKKREGWKYMFYPAKKNVRTMKIVVLLFFLGIVQIYAIDSYAQKTKLSLDLENTTIESVLLEIEKQSSFNFIYNKADINVNTLVNIRMKDKTINEILDELLKDKNIDYSFYERQVILSEAKSKNVQEVIQKISGIVTDGEGLPLPGVTVIIKSTTQGTVTDAGGNYSLANVPSDSTLVFSFVGMITQEIPVDGKSTINVVLAEETVGIEEVVAIGYGTMKRSDLTGSVSSVSSETFMDQPSSSVISVLSGRAPGVTVRRNNAAPGAEPMIRIRGANSLLGDNNPLIVVDGNYSSMPDMYDIESVEILKDASATAIYGSRGANGVILVKTKRGSKGKPTVKLYSDISFDNAPQRYDLMDAYEFAEFNNQVGAYPFTNEELTKLKTNKGVDWQDEIMQTGLSQSYKAIFTGGTDNVRYYFSPDYKKTTGIVRNTEASGYGLNAKVDLDLSESITVQIESTLGHSDNLNPGLVQGGSKTTNPLMSALIWSPTEPIYTEEGSYNRLGLGSGSASNPILLTEINNTNYRNYGSGVGNLKIKIIEGLEFDAKGSVSINTGGTRNFESNEYTGVGASASQSAYESKSWLVNGFLTYTKSFAGSHNLSVMAGMEETKSEIQDVSAEALLLPIESAGWYNLGLASPNIAVGSGWANSAMRSYFARLNYNYASKYYLTMNYRADGSSKFRGDNQFSYFPSFSLAWRLSEENFMKNQDIFQNLKIRGGWGITGSQAIDAYATFSSLANKDYTWGDVPQVGYHATVGGNPSLKWESTKQFNGGIDISTFNNRLSIALDYYDKKTVDLLAPLSVPYYNGGGSVISNVGSVKNRGFEINFNYDVLKTKTWSYDFNLNGSVNNNEVLEIGEQEMLYGTIYGDALVSNSPFVLMPGQPIGSIYGYKYLGIWQENEAAEAAKFEQEPGDYKYEDLNDNNTYDAGDNQIIGNSIPPFTWGFNNHISYKNLHLNILFEGVHGRDVMNWSYLLVSERIDITQTYSLSAAKDRWTPDNPDAEFAKIGNSNRLSPLSSQFVQDASYIKLRNIGLTYYIPQSIFSLAKVKLSVSAQNILTFTNYKGLDPEISSTSGDTNSGMDWFAYPNPKSISFGVSIEY